MRYENFTSHNYYYVSNEGVSKEKIFIDDRDYARFIFLVTHFQSPIQLYNIAWHTEYFIKKGYFKTNEKRAATLHKERDIELIAFTLMPNSFHLLVRNLKEGILSVYMHRILTAYSKYFNARYNRKGHVFGGPFNAEKIKNNNQLLYVSAHIHREPQKLDGWAEKYDEYPFSSLQDYINKNRWEYFLSSDTILKQFKTPIEYAKFIKNSS